MLTIATRDKHASGRRRVVAPLEGIAAVAYGTNESAPFTGNGIANPAPSPSLACFLGLTAVKVDFCQHASGLAGELAEQPIPDRLELYPRSMP
jgi:hypothetical protein